MFITPMSKSFPINKPITIMRDDLIITQLPMAVRQRLGSIEETGFHLGEMRRDIFCTNGDVQYKLGSKQASVTFN